MYAQARASLNPAPRTQSNQDAPLQPNQSSSSPSLDSPIGLIPSKNSSRPTSVNGQYSTRRDSAASPNLPISPGGTPTLTSPSQPNHQALNTKDPIRWVVLGVNSISVEFVKGFGSVSSSGNSNHQLAAVVDSDSKAASQLIDSLPRSSPKVGNGDESNGVEKIEVFEVSQCNKEKRKVQARCWFVITILPEIPA